MKHGSINTRVFLFACAVLVLNTRANGSPQKSSGTQIEVVESLENQSAALVSKPPIQFGSSRSSALTIRVDESVQYQTIDGFGASLTDSSVWLLDRKLDREQRKALLETLFDAKKGIGLSVLRQPMGASDFALASYSYDDVAVGEQDPKLAKFSIEHDRAYIIPVLKEALALNPNLKIIASPWSPPGWMKTSQSMIQGTLLPEAYPAFANYFVKFIKAYADAGVPIYAVTMQNEPLYTPENYPGMGMTAIEQAAFLRDHLGPALREAGLTTKVFVFDHNWDLIEYPIQVLSDAKAAAFASGTATHCYGGVATAQMELHERFPEKEIWMTECSGGEWQKGNLLEQQVRLIINSTRNWAKALVFWNLALDQNHEPFLGGCATCRGVVIVNHAASPTEVVHTVDFTALAHVSKFLRPWARRIASNSFEQGSLEDVAFQNPDGSVVLLVLNSSGAPLSFNIAWRGEFASYKLPAGSVATFCWQGSASK
ncbi:MAG: glucosylceramidase [Acidobacteriota bacterium]|nr:glucosylceramidase [Acidobacteriota bacterium]